jgi:hypothetical protein
MDLRRKFVGGRVLGYNVENGLKPLLPDFSLIARTERLGRKSIRRHRLLRVPAESIGAGDLCCESVGPCPRTLELNQPREEPQGIEPNKKRYIKRIRSSTTTSS